ncbi:MAG: hypothetical protein QW487_07590 [Candidatus Bathyarchaeia archaeon]
MRKHATLSAAIKQALELINFDFKLKLKKIVIKPNLCYYWDSNTGETTDPELVKALIDLLRSQMDVEEIYRVRCYSNENEIRFSDARL